MSVSTPSKKSIRASLLLVLSVTFFDYLGYALIIPLIPLIILKTPYSLVDPSVTLNSRYLILGLLLSMFPLAQFVGSPLIGALSDRLDRKKILLLSFAGNALGYLLCLLGIFSGQLAGVFLGHFVAGLTGANVATVNAVIADLTSKSKRTRKFSLSTMTMGSAFILGPYLSGKWMALLQSPVKTGIYIFGLASLISCLSFLITKLFFHWEEKGPLCLPSSPFALLKEVASVLKQSPNLKLLFTAVFALYFGWYSFIKFFQVFLIQQMELDQKAYCNVLSYFGFCCLASQLLFYLIFSKVLKERVSLRFFPILLGAAILSFLFIHDYYALIVAVTLFALSYSLISPSLNSVISQHGSLSTHGKIMGMSQSVQSLAKLLSPGIAGAMMATSLYSPIVVSCILITLTSALFAFASPKASATAQIDSRS